MKIAIDYDGTLVDAKTGEWLPGALQALRELPFLGVKPFIHTCRANWPEGLVQVENKLAAAHIEFPVYAKPDADLYVDNQAIRFESWAQIMAPLRHELAQAEGLKLARKMLSA